MSKRNSRTAKARRRKARPSKQTAPSPMEAIDLNQCRWPDCRARWTVDIQRWDGFSAFLCVTHAYQVLLDLDESEIKCINVESDLEAGDADLADL